MAKSATLVLVASMMAATVIAFGDLITQVMKNSIGGRALDPEEDGIVRVIGAENPLIKWDSSDASVPTANAGIVLTLTDKFFADYNAILVDTITDNLNGMAFEDYCLEQGLGTLVKGHWCVQNQKMQSYSVDREASRLTINGTNSSLGLRVSKINMYFEMDYKMWSEPEWLNDAGSGFTQITDCDIDLQLGLSSNNGVL